MTVSDYTRSQDFRGAAAVLSDLGEPTQPFTVLEGRVPQNGWVDVELLLKLKA